MPQDPRITSLQKLQHSVEDVGEWPVWAAISTGRHNGRKVCIRCKCEVAVRRWGQLTFNQPRNWCLCCGAEGDFEPFKRTSSSTISQPQQNQPRETGPNLPFAPCRAAAVQLPRSRHLKICLYKNDGEQPVEATLCSESLCMLKGRLHNFASANVPHPIKKDPQSPQARDAGKVER
jgi:hypothetical protein